MTSKSELIQLLTFKSSFSYFAIISIKIEPKIVKNQFFFSSRTYLDPNSKKTLLPLKEPLGQQLQADYSLDPRASRPRTPFLQAFTKDYRTIFENQFQRFSEIQASEHNMQHPEDFASLNQTELLTLLGDSYNPKDFDFDEEKVTFRILFNKH